MSADRRLDDFIGSVRTANSPAANYRNATRWGNLMFLSGKSVRESVRGKLGEDFTTEDGQRFAREVALELLLVLRDELGSLDRIKQFVELQGFINATENFEDHAKVLDGASNVLVEVLGEIGIHSRSVLGATSLRGGHPIVLRAVVGIDE